MVSKTEEELISQLQREKYDGLKKAMSKDPVWKSYSKYLEYISIESPSMGYDEKRILAGNLTLAKETSVIADVVFEGRKAR